MRKIDIGFVCVRVKDRRMFGLGESEKGMHRFDLDECQKDMHRIGLRESYKDRHTFGLVWFIFGESQEVIGLICCRIKKIDIYAVNKLLLLLSKFHCEMF